MVNIPIWLFVILVIASSIFTIIILIIWIDIISQWIYELYELKKYKNKEKNK